MTPIISFFWESKKSNNLVITYKKGEDLKASLLEDMTKESGLNFLLVLRRHSIVKD